MTVEIAALRTPLGATRKTHVEHAFLTPNLRLSTWLLASDRLFLVLSVHVMWIWPSFVEQRYCGPSSPSHPHGMFSEEEVHVKESRKSSVIGKDVQSKQVNKPLRSLSNRADQGHPVAIGADQSESGARLVAWYKFFPCRFHEPAQPANFAIKANLSVLISHQTPTRLVSD
jgi:hypothetical protein